MVDLEVWRLGGTSAGDLFISTNQLGGFLVVIATQPLRSRWLGWGFRPSTNPQLFSEWHPSSLFLVAALPKKGLPQKELVPFFVQGH